MVYVGQFVKISVEDETNTRKRDRKRKLIKLDNFITYYALKRNLKGNNG